MPLLGWGLIATGALWKWFDTRTAEADAAGKIAENPAPIALPRENELPAWAVAAAVSLAVVLVARR